MVRILTVTGQVLVEPFVTDERPIGISENLFLTLVNNKYIMVRKLDNIIGSVWQVIDEPNIPGKIDCGRALPGPDDSFLFMYNVLPPTKDPLANIPAHMLTPGIIEMMRRNAQPVLPQIHVVKYDYINTYGNIGQFLDEKLG